jgi:hypothetical protein
MIPTGVDVEYLADDGLAPGSCRVLSDTGTVDATLSQKINDCLIHVLGNNNLTPVTETELLRTTAALENQAVVQTDSQSIVSPVDQREDPVSDPLEDQLLDQPKDAAVEQTNEQAPDQSQDELADHIQDLPSTDEADDHK